MQHESIDRLNDRVAETVTKATGNMWFFWIALAFIVFMRAIQPPPLSQLLLDLENDLQLLLLATAAVVSAKQFALLLQLVRDIRELMTEVRKLSTDTNAEVHEIDAEVDALRTKEGIPDG